MDTVSFFVRASLWGAAAILLAWAVFVEAGVLNFSLTFLAALLAWGYGWLDKAAFGDLLDHAHEPESIVEEVRDSYLHRQHPDTRYQTQYRQETPEILIRVLEDLRKNDTHVRFLYGDVDTGRAERSVTGYVHRATGTRQIPLLGPRSKRAGSPIMDHCILQVVDLDRDFLLYQHPSYHEFEEEDIEAAAS